MCPWIITVAFYLFSSPIFLEAHSSFKEEKPDVMIYEQEIENPSEERQPRLTEIFEVPQSDGLSIVRTKQNLSTDSILSRQKRYKILYRDTERSIPDRWEVDRLTWRITKETRQMTSQQQRSIMRKSFQKWQSIMKQFRPSFRLVEETRDVTPGINIRFERGRHAARGMTSATDPDFDGDPGPDKPNKLGHAWGPRPDGPDGVAGDMHFDAGDDWRGEEGRQRLTTTVVHEIGHVLGLKHSQDPDAVMYPVSNFAKEIGQDDIDGIEALYGNRGQGHKPGRGGHRKPTTHLPQPRVFTEPTPNLCNSERLQVFRDPSSRGRLYVTVGDVIHQVDPRGQVTRRTALTDEFPGAPPDADLAFSLPTDRSVYFLKDNKVWVYRQRRLVDGYPRRNPQRQPDRPQYYVLDPRYDGRRSQSTTINLFGAGQCWSYVPRTMQMSSPRPRASCHGGDLPSGVRFTGTWVDGKTYAVSHDSYVVLNTDRSLHKAAGRPDWMEPFCSASHRSSLSKALILLLFSSILTTMRC